MSEARETKKLTQKTLRLASALYMSAQINEAKFEAFMEGLKAGLEIEGDYNLNFVTGMMEPVEKPPQEKEEA